MTYKEQSNLIQYLINLSFRRQLAFEVNESSSNLLVVIQHALNQLSVEQREIIQNDFIVKQDKNWYLGFYSRTTYYRLKGEAMSTFLNCLGLL